MKNESSKERFDAVLKFILESAPDFLDQVRGASPEEIGRLQETVRFPLPPDYKAFLATMGHKASPLQFYPHDLDVAKVIGSNEIFAENRRTGEGWYPPEDYVLIGHSLSDLPSDLFLHDGDHHVVSFPPEIALGVGDAPLEVQPMSDLWPEASSFSEYLFLSAVRSLRLRTAKKAYYSFLLHHEERPTMREVRAVLSNNGVQIHPLSGAWYLFGEDGGASIDCIAPTGGGVRFTLYANEPARLAAAQGRLIRWFPKLTSIG